MSRRDAIDVVVVGAGMVGAAAALGLAREGFRVGLVEAHTPQPWQGDAEVGLRVSALSRASRHLLERLGVWAGIAAARVSPYRSMRVWEDEAEIGFDAADGGDAELGHIVENALVADRLWSAIQREPGIEVYCPSVVVDTVEQGGAIALALDDDRMLHARVAVAADGAASPSRALAGIEVDGRDYRQKGLVLHVRTELAHRETAWQRFQPGGPLALLPLADGRCSIVWTLPEDEAERLLEASDEELSDRLTAASEARLGRLTVASARAAFPLRLGLARRYRAGRLVLAGDAAHLVHPLAGQGVNLGFLDVAELARTLIAARTRGRDIGAADVLDRYARARRSENALAAFGFDALERLFAQSNPAVAALRRSGLVAVDRIAPLKRFFMRRAAG